MAPMSGLQLLRVSSGQVLTSCLLFSSSSPLNVSAAVSPRRRSTSEHSNGIEGSQEEPEQFGLIARAATVCVYVCVRIKLTTKS